MEGSKEIDINQILKENQRLRKTLEHKEAHLRKVKITIPIILEELNKDWSSNYGDIDLQYYLDKIETFLSKY